MIYNIKGFRKTEDSWEPISEDGTTVEQHYKNECRRLGIYDRGDLHRIKVGPEKSKVDIATGESVSVALTYIRRRLDEVETSDGGTEMQLVDEVETLETTAFEVEIEDPDGNVAMETFDPIDGEASFSLTPDKTGT